MARPHALIAVAALSAFASTGHAANQALDAARQWAGPLLAGTCTFPVDPHQAGTKADRAFDLRFRLPGQDQDSPDARLALFQLLCAHGPTGDTSVFVVRDAAGYRLLSFAMPRLDYDYADEDFTRLTAPPRLIGYATATALPGAAYDPAAQTITMRALWSPRGDAWSASTWTFRNGEFLFTGFAVDPTYDGPASATSDAPASYRILPAPIAPE